VDIIFLVTVVAVTGCRLEYRGQMTLLAWSYRVHPVQREAGHGMIETDPFTPAVLIMACITLLSFLALVDIIRRMAAETTCSQAFRSQFTPVTQLALNIFMLSP